MPATYLAPGVYVEEVSGGSRPIEGAGTAVAAFVGLAEKGPFNTPTLCSNWTQFVNTFGGFTEGCYLAHAVYGYFLNGGGNSFIVRIGGEDGAAPVSQAELGTGPDAKLNGYRISALEPGPAGNDITVETQEQTGEGVPDDTFKMIVKKGGKVEETFDNLTPKKTKQNAVTVVNAQSKLIRLEEIRTGPIEKVGRATVALSGGTAPTPSRLRADDYVGDPADRTGFGGLETIDTVTMVSVPDLMSAYIAGQIDSEGVQAVQLGMIAHCEQMGDRMAILDPPPNLNAQQVREWRVDKAGYDSKYAALYWPWIKVADPATGSTTFVPPSGHMAGIWARTDATRGVHKAPANEVVRGAITLEFACTRTEQELLNPEGINLVKAFPGRGIRVWGARTLSSDPEWRYLNVRRLFNYLEKSILNGTDWAVFEPNDWMLWSALKRNISSFLSLSWRSGALFGLTPDQAFFVKCDEETNPPEVIDAGQVICEIGVAPTKPAEFVIFRLSQWSGGGGEAAEGAE
ncbi:MAG: phage tail sheath family protein [Acidimicrobiales bacterium]